MARPDAGSLNVDFELPWSALHGELAQEIRAIDWSLTSLGAFAAWPAHLHAMIDFMLAYASPALLLHGSQQVALYNDALASLIGNLHPALLGSPLAEIWPALVAVAPNKINAASQGSSNSRLESVFSFQHGFGEVSNCLDLRFTALSDEHGHPIAMLALIDDITAQKNLEHALHSDPVRLSTWFEQAQVGLSEIKLDGRFLRVNETLCRMLGRSRQTLLSLGVADVTHPDDVARNSEVVGLLVASGQPVSLDKRYLRPDSSIIWANSSLSRLDPVSPGAPYTLLAVTVDLTDRTLAKQALAENEARFRVLAEASPVLMWQINPNMRLTYANPKCHDLFGDAITGPDMAWASVLHPEDAAAFLNAAQQAVMTRRPFQQRARFRCMDGRLLWLEAYAGPWLYANGDYAGHVGIGIDITETVRTHEELIISNDRLNLAIDGSGDGVWDWNVVTDKISCSRRMKEIIGLSEGDLIDTFDAWTRRIHQEDLPKTVAAVDACLRGQSPSYNAEYRVRCNNNMWKWILARAIVVARDHQNQPLRMTGTITDISHRQQSQELVWLQANFDVLTGLPNRRLFRDRLDHQIRSAQRNDRRFALLFIDLDHFKEANDLLGHDAGDRLLGQAAHRIVQCVRASDTVARLGGDEFTAILMQVEEQSGAEAIASKINDALAEPFKLGHEVVHLSASIGITLYPANGRTSEELIRNADQAMYAAKNGGRNQFDYFTPEMQQRAQIRQRLIADLRGALFGDQLEVFYQPIVNLPGGRIVKAEALLRWNHPRHGLLEPGAFITFAEESGLIVEIGDWVFKQATACSQRWRHIAGDTFQISVNRSPIEFMARVDGSNWPRYLSQLGINGNSISVEITEAVLLHASSRVERQLIQFRDAGIQVAIDDFGTGYSSLAYLKKFEIDYLKIDQSFIHDMAHNESDWAIVRSVTAMAHELGLQVVAEGIETLEQHDLLVKAGCDFGQGFYYARPLPQVEFERVLKESLRPH